MKSRLNVRILSALALALSWLCPAVLAKETGIKFHGTVTVEQTTTVTGTVTVHVVGFNIPVKVTADSDIVLHGDKVGLAGVEVNDFVKVDGFFSSSGIEAMRSRSSMTREANSACAVRSLRSRPLRLGQRSRCLA